jgi:dihydrodipicolinate synthase/N-acetylneuraminate lyase
MKLDGVFAPVPTPFEPGDGGLDVARFTHAFARWVKGPLAGFVVLGSNGEAALMDDLESDRAIGVARDAIPGSCLLIAGTGRESTAATIAATKRAPRLAPISCWCERPGSSSRR